jgi:multiple sugar transport system ATP-binding protein
MAEIVIRNLRKEFGSFTAVQASSFKIEDGEFFMLLGPSGCGKTTTLRMIAGLELPTAGEIRIDGEEVAQKPASQRDIAFVFQMFALYPHMNVRKNISYPLISQGMPRAQVKAKVDEVAAILGIGNILDKPVGGLSGGDRQRVALGRAIVRNPKAFMMDEPLGALDAEFREHMSLELRALHDRMKATTVYVTHDQLEAMQMGDKIVVMNHGVVEQFGKPQEVYDKPATTLSNNKLVIPQMREPFEGDLAFGVRPEHIRLTDKSKYRGEVKATEYLGTTQIVTLKTLHGIVKARTAPGDVARVGETVGLEFNAKTITLFDTQTGRALRSELNEGVLAHG